MSYTIKRHGHASTGKNSPTYKSWLEMNRRCSSPSIRADYHLYRGRGISVCVEWKKFENFLADMGERPVGMSLDRINNDGDYEPANCRWATPLEQMWNTRRVRLITYGGKTQSMAAWSLELKLARSTISGRIRRGVPPLRALLIPGRKNGN